MKIYLVGGAVRDKLLNLPVKEKDWVVVGATPKEMLNQGFRPVGKDFPVFLHPITHEEYALARTERKVGLGYTGFDFNASADVTLEEDLIRRDLTINAMAQTEEGELVDPYHGQQDLNAKVLRHVSPAFLEDPVRILRVGRFAARYAYLGFYLAPETVELMQKMVQLGEVDALVPERVWKELERALSEKNPESFFEVLKQCDAFSPLFPEITNEGLRVLTKAAGVTTDVQIRFAALLYDVSEIEIKHLCERYRVPSDYRELALLVARYHAAYNIRDYSAEEMLNLLQSVDAFRRIDRFKKFLQACKIITNEFNPNSFEQALEIAKTVNVQELLAEGYSGQDLAKEITKKRIEKIQATKKTNQ